MSIILLPRTETNQKKNKQKNRMTELHVSASAEKVASVCQAQLVPFSPCELICAKYLFVVKFHRQMYYSIEIAFGI